jgi:hypothetical protein
MNYQLILPSSSEGKASLWRLIIHNNLKYADLNGSKAGGQRMNRYNFTLFLLRVSRATLITKL